MTHIGRRLFLRLLGAATTLAGGAAEVGCGAPVDADAESNAELGASAQSTDGTYDYIVVGSGAGGGPLAANLAKSGFRVLVLEAGQDIGSKPIYKVPLLNAKATESKDMSWEFFVKHYDDPAQQAKDSKLTPKGVFYPRAGTLGGCTAQNAMITVRPHARDWDRLATLSGDPNWSSTVMDAYFTRLEKCEYLVPGTPTNGHGTTGWLRTSVASPRTTIADPIFLRIIAAADIVVGKLERAVSDSVGDSTYVNDLVRRLRRDLNRITPDRDAMEGIFSVPMSVSSGRRNGPRDYLVRTRDTSTTLTIQGEALVTRVLFERREGVAHAVGVEYLAGSHQYEADPRQAGEAAKRTVRATREVILCGGTFNTPQLLMLSGIGPIEELQRRELGISVVVDLPGVGRNLQDRYEICVVNQVESEFLATRACTFDEERSETDPCALQLLSGQGPYSNNGVVCGIVKRSQYATTPEPDLFLFGIPADFRGYKPGFSDGIPGDRKHFAWAVLKAHTSNRSGSITLRSANPTDVPEIAFRYFPEGESDPDLQAVIDGVELARSIGNAVRGVPGATFTEVFPGPNVRTRADIAQVVQNEAWGHHACGTCKIGAADDPDAVLDGQFRVRGVSGLRVVDASVFPEAPGFFIATSVYMASEKATDDILESAGRPRRTVQG